VALPHAPSKKPLSLREMQNRARKFVADWQGETRENAESQSWWNDFFDIFGVARREVASYERWAKRASTGRQGRIDVFMPGVMIAEHKSLGKDEGRGVSQAEDYLRGGDIGHHEYPRFLVSCDFDRITLDDLESDDPAFSFRLKDLPKYVQRFAFLGGYTPPRRRQGEGEAVSVKAARSMSALHEVLLGDVDTDEDSHQSEQAAIFMTRILFLLYGDDAVGLWEPGSFEAYLKNSTSPDGADVGPSIAYLFQILDTPPTRRSATLSPLLSVFPYVNGGLFADRVDIPDFTAEMRQALLSACELDWAGISPAIFGSLFQGLTSREERRAHGEHYTTETNILKVLRPLFLDEFEERLQLAWTSPGELRKLRTELGGYRYLDPACGCGNFLIVAYREMADIEFRILARLRELSGQMDYALDPTWGLQVTPDHFGGIEINWWPAKIAETAMFLTQHRVTQQLGEIGEPPSILPIREAASIVHANALVVDWCEAIQPGPRATYVFGNPPFIGQYSKSAQQTEDMKRAWGTDYDGYLDYVTAWHAKALNFLRDAPGCRFGFVTTNSITQGQPVPALFRPILRDGWRIRFAHRTFAWTSEASGKAAVHCVIVGFDRDPSVRARLWEYETPRSEPLEVNSRAINPYLVDAPVVLVEKRSKPLSVHLPPVIYGSKPTDGGYLLSEGEEARSLRADPVVGKYMRPFVGARELINGGDRWCLWLETVSAQDLRGSELLRERVENVKRFRLESPKAATKALAATPAVFAERRQPSVPYLCIPSVVSEQRPYLTCGRFEPDVVTSNLAFTAPDVDGFLFGVISSAMFMTWQKTVGGRLKSDLRFSNTIVWNNFPLTEITELQRARVIEAGQNVLRTREEHPGSTLADLYHPLAMPQDLVTAHKTLDRTVDSVFGFRKAPTLLERQERLFDRYAQLTNGLSRSNIAVAHASHFAGAEVVDGDE